LRGGGNEGGNEASAAQKHQGRKVRRATNRERRLGKRDGKERKKPWGVCTPKGCWKRNGTPDADGEPSTTKHQSLKRTLPKKEKERKN